MPVCCHSGIKIGAKVVRPWPLCHLPVAEAAVPKELFQEVCGWSMDCDQGPAPA